MKARKPQTRERARTLRGAGWPLRRIANELNVALSTVSRWVRDIDLPLAEGQNLRPADPTLNEDVAGALEVRRCGSCRKYLPLANFNRHRSGHQSWCRDCYRAYFRARADRHRNRVHLARRDRRQKGRAFVSEYLRKCCCADCGETHPVVLEFHHLGEKDENVADMVRAGSSIGKLKRELEKCVVVCANCHRIRTAESRRSWRLDPSSLDSCIGLTPGERRNLGYVRDLLMASCCVDCGDSRLVVLDFDHVGEKAGNVVDLARRGCSLARLEAETSQCVIRCANCHCRRTALARRSD